MPVLIQASVERAAGWVSLRFPYNAEAKDAIKAVPGSQWDPERKVWRVPTDALPMLKKRPDLFKIMEAIKEQPRDLPLTPALAARLKPYQVEGAKKLIAYDGYMLAMDPRTGKTPTAITAICSLFDHNMIDLAIVLYPASVQEEWSRQLKEWAGIDIIALQGHTPLTQTEVAEIRATPYAVVGCHYEILSHREHDLGELISARRYSLTGDEIHLCKNPKAHRTKTMRSLARGRAALYREDTEEMSSWAYGTCVSRHALTGTPMRNSPRDLWAVLDFVRPDGFGKSFFKFGLRYCAGAKEEYGWNFSGISNPEELAERFDQIAYKIRRADVAAHLPPADYSVIPCEISASELKSYRKLEQGFAKQVLGALNTDEPTAEGREILKKLCEATSRTKMDTAVERVKLHLDRSEPGAPVKVIVAAHFHETAKKMIEKTVSALTDPDVVGDAQYGVFEAGGWNMRETRLESINAWKAYPVPAVLIVNSMSSGVGIDLSDAEVAILLEIEWVPSDLRQLMDRIVDLHLGKRKAPPLYEMLLVRGTIDESMVMRSLAKMKYADQVIGRDAEARALGAALRESGVVGNANLGLPDTDKETVQAALRDLRNRMLAGPSEAPTLTGEALGLEEDEESGGEEMGDGDDIPF